MSDVTPTPDVVPTAPEDVSPTLPVDVAPAPSDVPTPAPTPTDEPQPEATEPLANVDAAPWEQEAAQEPQEAVFRASTEAPTGEDVTGSQTASQDLTQPGTPDGRPADHVTTLGSAVVVDNEPHNEPDVRISEIHAMVTEIHSVFSEVKPVLQSISEELANGGIANVLAKMFGFGGK